MSIIAAGTTSTTGLVQTSDTTGNLVLQVNGTTPSLTLNTAGAHGVGSSPSYGTAGQFLTSQGSAASPTWTSVSIPSSAMTLISTQTSGYVWTGLSGYDKYILIYENIIPGTSNTQLQAVVGTGATPTYITSGYYGQGYSSQYNNGTGTTTQATTQNSASAANIGFINGGSTLNNTKASGKIVIAGTNSSTFVSFFGNQGNYGSTGWQAETSMSFAMVSVSAVVTAIKMTLLSGSISSGSASLYGISS